MLPRGGDTAEVCIIRVPVRRGYAFAVNDFVGWRALVQGKPQPQRKDLPVWVEGRDNVYSFGHADHLIFIIQTYVRKINRKNSDLDAHFLMSPDGVTGIQSISGNTWRRLQLQIINDDIAVFKSTDGGATWPDVKTLLTNADFRTSGVKLAEIFYDQLASSAVIKWTLSDNLIYQMVITDQGLRYDRWNGLTWENMWTK